MPGNNGITEIMPRSNDIMEVPPTNNDTKEISNSNVDTAHFRTTEEIKVFIMKSQKTYATVLFLLVGLAISLAIAAIQVTYKGFAYERIKEAALKNNSTYDKSNDPIKEASRNIVFYSNAKIGLESLLTVVTFATCMTLYYYYRTIFLLKKVRHTYPKNILFVRANPLFKKFIIEITLCMLHLPPLLSTRMNPKLQLIVFLRIYLIGRYLQQKHSLMHNQSTRCLARLANTELTSLFLLKASFRKYPFQMTVFGYTSFVLISTYVVWLLEETYSYFDTMWMLIIAMTTVGFGDLTPKTTLGRLAVTLTSLVGILFIAIFCFLASQALTLQRQEKRILAYYEIKENLRRKKIAAVNAIGKWYQFFSFKSKYFPSNVHMRAGESSEHMIPHNNKACTIKRYKLRCLKTKMYEGIICWRAIRNDPQGISFNQDFALEDMRIMVHNMSENVDELAERQIENLFPENEASDTESIEDEPVTDETSFLHNPRSSQANLTQQQTIPYGGNTETIAENIQMNTLPQQHIRNRTNKGDAMCNNQHGQPIFNIQRGQPTFDNQHGHSIFNQRGQPTFNNQHGQPILNNQHGQPIFNIQRGQPNLDNQHGQSIFNQRGQSIFNNQHGQSNFNNQREQPNFNNQRGQTTFNNQRGQPAFNIPCGQPNYNNPRGQPTLNNPNTVKILEELFSEIPHGEGNSSQRDKNIMIAFNLIKIQHNILDNAIESIYHKTKHDISDIQRRIGGFRRPTGNGHIYETGL